MTVGDPDVTLTAVTVPVLTGKTVAWQSDHSEYATVTDGVVHAVAQGSANITASIDGKSDTCAVTVNSTQQTSLQAESVTSSSTKTKAKAS